MPDGAGKARPAFSLLGEIMRQLELGIGPTCIFKEPHSEPPGDEGDWTKPPTRKALRKASRVLMATVEGWEDVTLIRASDLRPTTAPRKQAILVGWHGTELEVELPQLRIPAVGKTRKEYRRHG